MSLFKDKEVAATLHHPDDNSTTKKTDYDFDLADANLLVNVIRISSEDAIIFGEELGEYRANVRGTAAAGMRDGDIIVLATGDKYQIINNPKLQKLFDRYKINIKVVE